MNTVKNLAPEDNINGNCYRGSGMAYLRFIERLEHAGQGVRPLYYVHRVDPGSFRVSDEDESLIRVLPTLCTNVAAKAKSALWALANSGGTDLSEKRIEAVSQVFPYAYFWNLKMPRTSSLWFHALGGVFSGRIAEHNIKVQRFQAAKSSLESTFSRMSYNPHGTTTPFENLLRDIAASAIPEPQATDTLSMYALKSHSAQINPVLARRLLDLAQGTRQW